MFLATLRYWYTCSARPHHVVSGAHSWRALRGGIKKCTIPYGMLRTIVGIFPGTFLIFKSRDFWTSLVPGPRDHGTFKVSRSCPVFSRDLGPLVPGLPGMSQDLIERLFEKKSCKKSIPRCMFWYLCKFVLTKLLIFDRALVMNFSGDP